MDVPRADLEGWLEHAGWIRALGIELVGRAEADDLVQDAWVVALEHSGRARNPGAWLSGVLRRLAGRRRHGAERRARRERAGARPEGQPAADELVAEAEVQRKLLAAVTALDEPQRATVLLRFYRGWTPEEIARAQGVPSATVRTRLHRALARLRERLDREHGGREAWALCFVGPGTITGGALVGAKTVLAGAGVVAALGGWALWQGVASVEEGSARRERGLAAADAGPAGARQAPPAPAPAGGERARRIALDPAPEGAAGPGEVLLFGSVADERGQPVALEWLGLEDGAGAVRSASRPVAGSYSVAGLTPGRYTLKARAAGFLDHRDEIVLPSGSEHRQHDLVLEPGLSIPVKIVDELGEPFALARGDERLFLDVVATREPPGDGLSGLNRHAGRIFGCGTYASDEYESIAGLPDGYDGLLRLTVPPPVHVSVVLQDATVATRLVERAVEELVFTLDRAAFEQRLGGVRARFVDAETGLPILDGKAALDPPSHLSGGGAPVGEGGVAFLSRRAPGLHTLRFFHERYARMERSVRVPQGQIEDLGDVPVWPAVTLRGTVVDARGEPASASIFVAPLALVRGAGDLPESSGRAIGGRFTLERVPRTSVRLFMGAPDHARLCRTIDASGGDVDGIVLRLEEGVRVVLRSPEAARGRQLTLADGEGVPIDTWTLAGATITTRLAPGTYQVWTGRAERVETVEELVVGDSAVDWTMGSAR